MYLHYMYICTCVDTVMDEIQHRENEDEEFTLDPEREAYYKDDPKKALKKYFDREGTVYTHTHYIIYP